VRDNPEAHQADGQDELERFPEHDGNGRFQVIGDNVFFVHATPLEVKKEGVTTLLCGQRFR
jgi:hypothetical protein